MKDKNKKQAISSEELSDFYDHQSKVEQQKKESSAKVMKQQLFEVTRGKGIVISNRFK